MCMYVPIGRRPLKPKVAKSDIKCFKIVAIDNEKNIHSAVRKFPYRLNKTYTAEGDFSKIYYTGHYESTNEEKMVMVRCHIPKGSLYYMGEPNYVSQSIVIDEIIHDN